MPYVTCSKHIDDMPQYPGVFIAFTPGESKYVHDSVIHIYRGNSDFTISDTNPALSTSLQLSNGTLTKGVVALTDAEKAAAQDGLNVHSCALIPDVIAHRGMGSQVAPDNAMSSYKMAAAARILNIEQDVHLLSDGSLGCMHDTTADATTTGTGAIASLTGAQFKALVMDVPITLNAPSWQNETPPLFSEVVRELAGSGCVFWPEAKNTKSGAGIVSVLARHGIPTNRAVVQAFNISELSAAISYGYGAAYGVDPATADFTALAASGVTHVFWSAWTDAQVIAAHAAGIKTVIYTINRRSDWAIQKAKGVDFVFSDDPQWTSGSWVPMERDPYITKTWPPGMFGNTTSQRGMFINDGEWAYNGGSDGTYKGVLQGWGCPIKNDDGANSFTIELNLALETVSATDRFFGAFVCASNDANFQDGATTNTGYHLLVRQNGVLDIYRKAGATATKIATYTGAALALSTFYLVRISVTPTSITLSLPNVSGASVTVADSTYRGGYFHFGESGAYVRVKDVVIS